MLRYSKSLGLALLLTVGVGGSVHSSEQCRGWSRDPTVEFDFVWYSYWWPFGRHSVDTVMQCVNLGADPNARYLGGSTPLFWMSDPNALEALLKGGADIGTRDLSGQTALNALAGLSDRVETLAVLLEYGAEINTRDDMGNTPLLTAAAKTKNPNIIVFLLEFGADGTVKNAEGETAFKLAKGNSVLSGTKAFWALNDARFEAGQK